MLNGKSSLIEQSYQLYLTYFNLPLDNSQVRELNTFTSLLCDQSSERAKGQDKRGHTKGTMNHQLSVCMLDIKAAGDLIRLQRTSHVDCLASVERSVGNIIAAKLVPPTCRPNSESIRLAYRAVSDSKCTTNQELLKLLYDQAKTDPRIQPYLDMVIRLWLLSPPESVVESMASVVEDVFGPHRHKLDPLNAERELIIRSNGLCCCCAPLSAAASRA